MNPMGISSPWEDSLDIIALYPTYMVIIRYPLPQKMVIYPYLFICGNCLIFLLDNID